MYLRPFFKACSDWLDLISGTGKHLADLPFALISPHDAPIIFDPSQISCRKQAFCVSRNGILQFPLPVPTFL